MLHVGAFFWLRTKTNVKFANVFKREIPGSFMANVQRQRRIISFVAVALDPSHCNLHPWKPGMKNPNPKPHPLHRISLIATYAARIPILALLACLKRQQHVNVFTNFGAGLSIYHTHDDSLKKRHSHCSCSLRRWEPDNEITTRGIVMQCTKTATTTRW